MGIFRTFYRLACVYQPSMVSDGGFTKPYNTNLPILHHLDCTDTINVYPIENSPKTPGLQRENAIMRICAMGFIMVVFSCNFTIAMGAESETTKISAYWLTGNIGAYNLPMPLKLEFTGTNEQIHKINIDAGAFHFSFRKNSNEMTVWVQYPKGTSRIRCSALNKKNVELESVNLQVPTGEIRDSNFLSIRFTAVIANDYNLIHNPRYANFILAERDVPTNWFNLIAFDELVIKDYRALNENQLGAIKNYLKSGGVVIIPTRFADAKNVLQKLKIPADFSIHENAVTTFKSRNYILLRSSMKFHAGLIQKYKISDNLNLSDELEIIRLDQKTQNIPFNLDILRNLTEYAGIENSTFLVNESAEQRNRLVLYIAVAMFLTMLILIIGLRQFKNLSTIEKQLLIIAFCLIISIVLLFMQDVNTVDSSSFTVTLVDNCTENPFNLNAEIKLLSFNHAATIRLPFNDGFIRILSADSEGLSEKMDISIDEKSYTVKTHAHAKLYIAKLDVNEHEKHLAIFRSKNNIVATNLSDNTLRKLVLVDDFKGTLPTNLEKYENLTLDAVSIPYRSLFSDYFEIAHPEQVKYAKFTSSIIRKNRQFVVGYCSNTRNNLRILLSPIR
ncbi:MAG: hypothetical protein K8S87_11990 [Planctomycetes bacterium]|nr:hypothetical protein [Planctomycetota bacterium]